MDSGGSDSVRFGIYRGFLKAGVGTNPGLNMTLVGQSVSNILTVGLPFNRIPIVAVAGQNLSFVNGEYMTIAFHSSGTSNIYMGSPASGFLQVNLAFKTLTNFVSAGFPSSITISPFNVMMV